MCCIACDHYSPLSMVGADASLAGSDGTALDVAVSMGKREAARVLRARVRDPCKMCGRPFFPLCFHVAAPTIEVLLTGNSYCSIVVY
jgi:hypothetical protein